MLVGRRPHIPMTLRSMFRPIWYCLACLAVAAGCRSGSDQLAPVKGKVTYQGVPVPGGTIVFIPDTTRGTHGNLAMADLQPDGSFALKTNDVLGAVPGHHR